MRWLTEKLKRQVREVFEPRYQRKLNDIEILEIAQNLTSLTETFLKLRCKNYGKQIETV